jgi:AAA15 family ATPase/GTPase
LLKTVFLYGNNGAGKSKLLMALDVLQHLVTTSREDKTDPLPYFEFALDPLKLPNEPSSVEMVYHFDDNRYRYLIKWNEQMILEERLTLLKVVTEAELYHRWYDEEQKVSKVVYGRAMNMDDDTAYVIRTSLLRNNSVISVITGTNIYNKVLHEAVEHSDDANFKADRYFMQHPDPQVSQLAATLGIDSHQLSRSFERETSMMQLRQHVQHLILDFRMDIVNQRMKDLQRQLKEAGSDMTRIRELMEEYKQIQEIRNVLARQRGSDVVV